MAYDPHVKKHFEETESLVKKILPEEIASWLLGQGFFPESYIFPPSFQVSNFDLKEKEYYKNLSQLKRKKLINIFHPKTPLTSRMFSIQFPEYYHDIVYHMVRDWDSILKILFDSTNKIYSYSIPIPVTNKNKEKHQLSNLRSGRMIYEWVRMAEKDLVLDAINYQYIARTDITNFYSSIYTHSIAWALHGREESQNDKKFILLGNRLDKLYQYSNDGRTNGIPIGSVLSDFIAEIILASIDKKISEEVEEDFVGVRFKDDYRFLCQSEDDARKILKITSNKLSDFNLILNEKKTSILKIPNGLYRSHNREYFPHSLSDHEKITFKTFEQTLLIALDIHSQNPTTSILEKFFSELLDKNRELKIIFSRSKNTRKQEIYKTFSLLFLAQRESKKILSYVLSIIDLLYIKNIKEFPDLKGYLQSIIQDKIKTSSELGCVFEVIWLIFFSRYRGLGIQDNEFKELVCNDTIKENPLYQSILESKQEFFKCSQTFNSTLFFTKPSECKIETLAKYFDIFSRK